MSTSTTETPTAETPTGTAPAGTAKAPESSTKLTARDLITVGIYTAIYFVIILVVAMLGMIPAFMVLLVVIAPLLAAIPFTMFLAKVRKPGMIFIMSIIMGLMMILTGMGYYTLILSIFTGIAAELIWRGGSYRSAKRIGPTYAAFSLWMWGNYLPYFLNRDAYIAARSTYGDAYWTTLATMLPAWLLPVLFVACIACALLGAWYAKKVLAKKLAAAGIN